MFYIQIVINGLLLGGVYACIAIGLSLVWGVMNMINLTHGSLIILGAYTTFYLFTYFQIDPFLTIPISIVLLFIFGFAIQKYLINLMVRAPLFMTFIFTFAMDMILVNLGLVIFGGDFKMVTPAYSAYSLLIGEVKIPYIRIATFLIAMLISGALFFFLGKTKTGMAIRSTRMDREAAKMLGVNLGNTYAITFGLSAAMAGAGGSLASLIYAFNPVTGMSFTFSAFIVSVIGGLGSVMGALVGGLLFGIIDTLGSVLISQEFKEALNFAFFVLFLIFKPSGILGKKYYEI